MAISNSVPTSVAFRISHTLEQVKTERTMSMMETGHQSEQRISRRFCAHGHGSETMAVSHTGAQSHLELPEITLNDDGHRLSIDL